tara:strand:- start:180 stop:338 length:159 start_codon:yes stop_codon:yes gene_type:complete
MVQNLKIRKRVKFWDYTRKFSFHIEAFQSTVFEHIQIKAINFFTIAVTSLVE